MWPSWWGGSKCQFGKRSSENTGSYIPLPIVQAPCVHISMDFVLGFPKTARRHDSIFCCSRPVHLMAPFLPCSKTTDAMHVTDLFFQEVVRLHGVRTTISDRHIKTWGIFGEHCGENLGPSWSISAHVTHKQMVRPKLSTGAWAICWGALLGSGDVGSHRQAEFAYNNSVNRIMKKTPFEAAYGLQPQHVLDPVLTTRGLSECWLGSFLLNMFAAKFMKKRRQSSLVLITVPPQHRSMKDFEEGNMILVYLRWDRFSKGTYPNLKAREFGPLLTLAGTLDWWSCHQTCKLVSSSMFQTFILIRGLIEKRSTWNSSWSAPQKTAAKDWRFIWH